jgi:hypothetical protein
MIPGGRITLVSGQPLMSADVTSATLWYAPYNSDTFPVFDGSAWQQVTFSSSPSDQVGPSLSCGSKWSAGTSRDVFGLANGMICTGPAWPAPDDISRNLIRYNGVKVNSAAMTLDTSATASVSVPQYQATWLGSIHNSVAGQLSYLASYGQDRKCEIWTAYDWNQVDIVLHVGVVLPTGVWVPTNQYPAWAPFNNDAMNRGTPFTGAPTLVDNTYYQSAFINSQYGASGLISVVGWDGVGLGYWNKFSSDLTNMASSISGEARYLAEHSVGVHTATMFVAKVNTPKSTAWSGAPNPPWTHPEFNQEMLIRYRG